MADVTLVLKADNSQYVNKIREAQQASQKLYDTVEKGSKREKGLIEDIEGELARLQEARRKAFSIEDIEKYNKKIQEAKKDLQEYEKAGLEVEKQTESMVQTFGKWIASLGLVTKLLGDLKKTFQDTIQGFTLFNQAAAAYQQILYNITNGVQNWNEGVAESIRLAKQATELRIKDNKELLQAKQLMQEYNKLYTEGIDATIKSEEKIKKLTEAKKKYLEAIDIEIESARAQLKLADEQWARQPASLKAMENTFTWASKVSELMAQKDLGVRRLTRQITGEIQEENNKRLKYEEDLANWIKAIEEEQLKDEQARLDESKKGMDDYYLYLRDSFFDYIDDIEKAQEDKWKFETDLARDNFNAIKRQGELLWDEIEKRTKKEEEEEKDAEDRRRRRLDLLKEELLKTLDFIQTIRNQKTQDAQRERELLDTQISETQSALETQLELQRAGYASNVAAKQRELDELNQKRRLALEEEEKAIERQQRLERTVQSINLASSVTNILKEFTKLGPLGLALSTAAIASLFKIFSEARSKSSEVTKYAKGGWTGKGTYRDETGQRVAGIVHEEEFVVKRGPAHRFRGVLEAINKEDKIALVRNFNKFIPQMAVNNITVENNGPNNRLDRINSQLHQLNNTLQPKKQAREEVIELERATIYKKGNTIRLVKR